MSAKHDPSQQGKDYFAPQRRRKKKTLLKHIDVRWAVTIVAWTFAISIGLSFASSKALDGVGYGVAFFVLLLFVFLGILFDIIGIAVATASEKPFHSMSSRRVVGAQEALWLIRRADKVSNFCNDVVGDVCGIISGTTAAVIAMRLVESLGTSPVITQLVVAGIVAALTVGGKAMGKALAMNFSTPIIYFLGRTIHLFFKIFKKSSNTGQ